MTSGSGGDMVVDTVVVGSAHFNNWSEDFLSLVVDSIDILPLRGFRMDGFAPVLTIIAGFLVFISPPRLPPLTPVATFPESAPAAAMQVPPFVEVAVSQ